jgi:hypothetical protein
MFLNWKIQLFSRISWHKTTELSVKKEKEKIISGKYTSNRLSKKIKT